MVTGVHDRHHSLKLKFPGLFLGPAIANPAPHPGRNQSSRHLPPLPSSSMGRFFFDGWVHPSTEPTSHLWMQIRVASNRKRSTSADPPPTLLSRTHIPAHTYVALHDIPLFLCLIAGSQPPANCSCCTAILLLLLLLLFSPNVFDICSPLFPPSLASCNALF